MKQIITLFVGVMLCTLASAAPFTPLKPDETYGVGTITWRLASQLSRNATGMIEFCYQEKSGPAQVLGGVDVRPFISSDPKMPDLRILFTQTAVNGTTKVVLVVGYGIRSGCFVAEAPGITSHAKFVESTPEANPDGEYTLLMSHTGNTVAHATRFQDAAGRLYFRYIPQAQ